MPNEIITKKLEEFEKMVTFDKERANFFMSNGELFSKSWLEKALVEVYEKGALDESDRIRLMMKQIKHEKL